MSGTLHRISLTNFSVDSILASTTAGIQPGSRIKTDGAEVHAPKCLGHLSGTWLVRDSLPECMPDFTEAETRRLESPGFVCSRKLAGCYQYLSWGLEGGLVHAGLFFGLAQVQAGVD